jgi:hypothetical protein
LAPPVSNSGNIWEEQRVDNLPGSSSTTLSPDQGSLSAAFGDPHQAMARSAGGWVDNMPSSASYTNNTALMAETAMLMNATTASMDQTPYEETSYSSQNSHSSVPLTTSNYVDASQAHYHYNNHNGTMPAETPWAELIAPVDPNFNVAHTGEANMIDEYWTSLMRDAGVLNNFPTF